MITYMAPVAQILAFLADWAGAGVVGNAAYSSLRIRRVGYEDVAAFAIGAENLRLNPAPLTDWLQKPGSWPLIPDAAILVITDPENLKDIPAALVDALAELYPGSDAAAMRGLAASTVFALAFLGSREL